MWTRVDQLSLCYDASTVVLHYSGFPMLGHCESTSTGAPLLAPLFKLHASTLQSVASSDMHVGVMCVRACVRVRVCVRVCVCV